MSDTYDSEHVTEEELAAAQQLDDPSHAAKFNGPPSVTFDEPLKWNDQEASPLFTAAAQRMPRIASRASWGDSYFERPARVVNWAFENSGIIRRTGAYLDGVITPFAQLDGFEATTGTLDDGTEVRLYAAKDEEEA